VTPAERSSKLIVSIVDVLRARREAKGISKKKLAALAGVSRTAIILLERHDRLPSIDLLLKLAAGMDIALSGVLLEAEAMVEGPVKTLSKSKTDQDKRASASVLRSVHDPHRFVKEQKSKE